MNKRTLAAVGAAAILLIVLVGALYASGLSDDDRFADSPQPGIGLEQGAGNSKELSHDSLNYKIFEEYGPVLLVLAVLMFGAMIGGICIAREEIERREEEGETKEEGQ